jgi:hypothetical protein
MWRVEAISAARREGEALGDYRPSDVGATLSIDFEVKTHREDVYVKILEFWMGLQRIVITVPEVTMRQQRWVYHTPSVRMKRVKVGQPLPRSCNHGGRIRPSR